MKLPARHARRARVGRPDAFAGRLFVFLKFCLAQTSADIIARRGSSVESTSIKVLLFGALREAAGDETFELSVPAPATVGSALRVIESRIDLVKRYQGRLLLAVNEEFASRDRVLAEGDTLALLPPVSGGSDDDIFEITREPLDYDSLKARLLAGSDGAVVTLDGVVRNNSKGRATRFLDYEAYESMALKVMQQLGREVHERWPEIHRVGIAHRLGRLEIGVSSVLVMVVSPHRKPAFEACRYAIDRLKQIVPIWKKEYFEDGEVWVEGEEEISHG